MTFSTRLIKKVNVSFKQKEGTNSISIYCLWIEIIFLLLYFKTKLQIIVHDLLKMVRYLINIFRESFHNSKLLLLKGSENKCIFTWRINHFSDFIPKCWYEQSENVIIHWLINIILRERPDFLEMWQIFFQTDFLEICQITFPVLAGRAWKVYLFSFLLISSEVCLLLDPRTDISFVIFTCIFVLSQMKFRHPELFKT